MKKLLVFAFLLPAQLWAQSFSKEEVSRWQQQAQQVNIIEDDWGIPHVYGKTDADAVFGLMYVQCEQSFERVELNHLEMMGRLSEVYGKNRLYEDLRMRMIYDTAAAIADYKQSPAWFQKLLNAYADGINFYIYKHPEVKPKALQRFEPWMALLRTNGSISATETGGVTLRELQNMYPIDDKATSFVQEPPLYDKMQQGSNGFAVAPAKTRNKKAILYINPHTSFFYRTEAHMISDEGLNAYGGVTWGTFFIFQGFNENCGWMHTSGRADVADLYKETVEQKGDKLFTLYDGKQLPVTTKEITIRYKQGDALQEQRFTTYATNHGPVMGKRNGQWLSLREYNRSLNALLQSWQRTKTNGFEEFKKVMNLRANTSDNTVFADASGNIAYWHGNYVPKRDPKYDYSQPLDGTTSATDWKGIHALDETVHVYNPKTGWIQNTNSTPFTVSGASSPKKEDFPTYMAPDAQNARAINAARLLSAAQDVTIDKMIAIGYDHYLSAFEILLPPLFKDYDALTQADPQKSRLEVPIHFLRLWDKYSSTTSIATTLAIEWASIFETKIGSADAERIIKETTAADRLKALEDVITMLEKQYKTWQVAWGDINRYQRTNDGKFDDNLPSLPVGMASSAWGSLPAYNGRRVGTQKRYGVHGNSFIAAVEFGGKGKLKAKTILVSGESFDPNSKHYNDQADGYLTGKFKDIYYYKTDVQKHAMRQYQPGK
ncbi:penicillin acylase family protein [Flavisolibacter tropicus]|uniref:Penicillin amidase n=1 Tax=Flavisolibacter tropicus TaxID=1492898 RepID=A0A172TX16_9BACT|nr:penicillin acylase family protein [Flavisolibacter tropicus]ANE51522.1 penicillin amidase [Flavisolibacter tropicus]